MVDGIPCYVEDRGGPFMLGLTFRVGFADEDLTRRGITHLVEHLSLFDAARRDLPVNGSVGPTETTLVVRGTPAETAAFVTSVCGALRNLPQDRLETEARVLRTEGANRPVSPLAALVVNRFGSRGYGLAWAPELWLSAPDAPATQRWATEWFTRANLTMWATGAPPPRLSVELPEGERRPAPVPEPLGWHLPAWFRDGSPAVGVSFLVPRRDASTLAVWLLERRLHARLRMEQGQSYQIAAWAEPWTAEHLHGVVGADSLPDHVGDVRDGILGELERLAEEPPAPEELKALLGHVERAWKEGEAAASLAASRASNALAGHPVRSVAQMLRDVRGLTPHDVTAAAADILGSAIVQVPAWSDAPPAHLTAIPAGSHVEVGGRTFRRARVLDQKGAQHRLVVGPDGVSFAASDAERATVTARDAVAVQRWRDGARTWWGADGLYVFVHPAEWKRGADAVAALDAATPTDLVVDMGEDAGSAYLEEVERRAATAPRRGLLARMRGR